MRKEPAHSTHEVWCFDGRRELQGEDSYVWVRYLPRPCPITGYTTLVFAKPVKSFWPEGS